MRIWRTRSSNERRKQDGKIRPIKYKISMSADEVIDLHRLLSEVSRDTIHSSRSRKFAAKLDTLASRGWYPK